MGAMTQPLRGKSAVVTGGSRGIGFAISRRLVEAGVSVVLCGRSRDSVERAVRELKAAAPDGCKVAGTTADISRREDVEALFAFADSQLPSLEMLVNNAGVGIFRNVSELEPEEWRQVLDTNLMGVYLCSRAAIPRFRNAGSGFIINISSLAGKNPFAGGAAYNASKFGLNGFSEAMMLELRYDNIRVTSIMPGSVSTEFGRGGAADWKIAPEDVAEVVHTVLALPDRTLVSAVEMRPSRPPKK
jgi:NAD(P)-dependent dehydrogenase (short-subunit alcohol dehydrogenase family)